MHWPCVCLVWVLHDFHIVQAMHEIANVDWKWVLLGMAFDVLSYGVQALRWKMLLKPFGNGETDALDPGCLYRPFRQPGFPAAPWRISAQLSAVHFGKHLTGPSARIFGR